MNTTTEPDKNKVDNCNIIKIIKRLLLKYRVCALILSASLGICLSLWWFVLNGLIPWCPLGETLQLREIIGIEPASKGKGLDSSLTTLFLALPTLFILWLFRTHDTREQIEKTKDQIEITKEQIEKSQNNTLTSILTHAMDMITSDDLKRRVTGLIQLGQLKKQTDNFNAQIDGVTRNLDLRTHDINGKTLNENEKIPIICQRALLMKAALKGMDLSDAKLRGADLEFADLTNTNLIRADLSDAVLTKADLTNSDLREAIMTNSDLTFANLTNANLTSAIMWHAELAGASLEGANLSGAELDGVNFDHATYNDETKFPEGFDLDAAGMF